MAAGTANEFSIKTFASKLVGGGALASLFQANITEAQGTLKAAIGDFSFLCKAANFPTSSIDVTEVSYMGRPFRVPGNRAAQDWTTTIYNDENFKIRNGFENWMELISSHVSNKRASKMEGINSYSGTLNVQQMHKTGGATKKDYVFTLSLGSYNQSPFFREIRTGDWADRKTVPGIPIPQSRYFRIFPAKFLKKISG